MPRRRLTPLVLLLLVWLCGLAGCRPAGSPGGEDHDHHIPMPQGSPHLNSGEGGLGRMAVEDDGGYPRVHQEHIFFGQINRQGEAVGFHYRATGEEAGTARIVAGTETRPDVHGVYQAQVEIRDPATGRWIRKSGPSSFFPDTWTPRQVLQEIRSAWRNDRRKNDMTDQWEGVSDSGVRIAGYKATDQSIVTAYPIRQRR